MKWLLVILSVLIYSFSYSQHRVNGYVGLSQSVPTVPFSKTNLTFGALFPKDKFGITVFGQYQLMGNRAFKKYYNTSAYRMVSNLLGGGIKLQLRASTKIYHPTLKLTVLTELFSNYKGEHLQSLNTDEYGLAPVNVSNQTYLYDQKNYYYTYYYISTPLVGNVILGNEFRLMEGLFINLGIGYSFNAFKVGFKKWGLDQQEPESEIVKPYSLRNDGNPNIEVVFRHAIVLNLGINYTFSFHKKEKPQP